MPDPTPDLDPRPGLAPAAALRGPGLAKELDRLVLETLRESGGMTASEVALEVEVDLGAAERSLSRLASRLLVQVGGFGVWACVEGTT